MGLNKRRVSMWYVAGGLVMAGLLAVQFFWIKNSLNLQQKELERNLKEDFDEAVKTVQESMYCFSLHSKTYVHAGEGFYILQQKQNQGKFLPALGTDTLDIYGVFAMKQDTVFETDNNVTFSSYDAAVDITYKISLTGTEGLRSHDSAMYNTEGINEYNFRDRLRYKNAFEIIDTNYLHRKITEVLSDNMLDTVFSAGIKGVNDNGWEYLHNVNNVKDITELEVARIKIPLQKDVINEPYMLYISLPNAYSKIIGSAFWMLISSILVVLILILSYIYFIRQFLNQKMLSEMKDTFINNITHEFRTPITNINLAVENWRGKQEKARYYIDIIDEENQHLERNVEQILHLATLEHAHQNMNKEVVDMHELILEVVDSFAIRLDSVNGKVEYDLNAPDPYISADGQQIKNMLLNLIDNSIKYRRGNPQIEVTTGIKNKMFELKVTDNGIGMDTDTQKRIFNRFYRSNTGDRHDVKGFGLGLSYVKYIVDSHKGEIQVKSRPDKGSVFIVYLPIK